MARTQKTLSLTTTSNHQVPPLEDPTPIQRLEDADSQLLAKTLAKWPRRLGKVGVPSTTRLAILTQGIHDIKKVISPRGKASRVTGSLLMKYLEVLNIIKVQALQEHNWPIRSEFILFKIHKQLARQIEEESTLLAVREYISQAGETVDSMGIAQAISRHLAEMNDDVIPPGRGRIVRNIQRTISSRSSHPWLQKLGFNWKEVHKGVYNNGHEREDVKQYRNEIFIPYLGDIKPAIMQWDNDLSPISNPELLSGQLEPIIMVTQDECTFNANDGRHCIWTHEEHQPLRKKGRGQGLHVSDLLTPIGRLGDGAACEILKCGGDIWWDGEKLLEQIKTKAIPLFKAEFPWAKALFLFDNAKTHFKYADDALRVSKMNLADGGKHAKAMRSTYVVDESHPNGGYYQSMVQEDGTPKGLKSVLTERGLWLSTGG
ncbi:hypothetical protein HOY80DRAFT_1041121 [Tuber brumale]|nr:hypothetical protein HOY80DRAFT_1041121 [Tuber brumale]